MSSSFGVASRTTRATPPRRRWQPRSTQQSARGDGSLSHPTASGWAWWPRCCGPAPRCSVWSDGTPNTSSAAYDPVTDTWRMIANPPVPVWGAIWIGDAAVLLGDPNGGGGSGHAYLPATDEYRRLADGPWDPDLGGVDRHDDHRDHRHRRRRQRPRPPTTRRPTPGGASKGRTKGRNCWSSPAAAGRPPRSPSCPAIRAPQACCWTTAAT